MIFAAEHVANYSRQHRSVPASDGRVAVIP